MTDQTVTPFVLNLSMSDEAKLNGVRIRLGEPGGGHLGISGPVAGSSDVTKRLWALDTRRETIDWVYEVEVTGYIASRLIDAEQ